MKRTNSLIRSGAEPTPNPEEVQKDIAPNAESNNTTNATNLPTPEAVRRILDALSRAQSNSRITDDDEILNPPQRWGPIPQDDDAPSLTRPPRPRLPSPHDDDFWASTLSLE